MGLTIGLGGGGNAGGGGGGVVASGLIQDMAGVTWTGTARIKDTTITEFPGADFRYCTSLQEFFYNCRSLVSVGEMKNTLNAKSASGMFNGCSSLQTVPLFDTSNVTSMSNMFSGCRVLQSVPLFNTAKVTNMNSMFNNCYELKSIPAFDTANVTNMVSMFNNCSALQTIGGINMINVTSESNASGMFFNCKAIVTANIANLGISLDLSYFKVLSIESVLYIFNNAKSGVSGKTIKLHADVFSQLSDEQIAIATDKGFNVASA